MLYMNLFFIDADSQNVTQTADEAEEWPSIKEVRGNLLSNYNLDFVS